MKKSKVYFTDMRCRFGDSLLHKLDRVLTAAGFDDINFERQFAAIKIHFGEPGNLAFLRPNFAKTVAERVKLKGGLPFLTDCGTLYVGRRTHAIAHMDAAEENGFNTKSTGCPIIIGDGLKGTDDVEVPIEGGLILKTALIGRAIMDADIIISLNHFKGHELTGFGGAIKNLGMGSGSRAGKMAMHNDGKPQVVPEKCIGCKACAKYCAQAAISFKDKTANIDHSLCVGCGRCLGACNSHAIDIAWDTANDKLNRKMAEYAKAVCQGRPNFHINIVNQVSPFCDCHAENDAAVIPDLGIFASFDPVALDAACIEAVNKANVLAGTIVDSRDSSESDLFKRIHPATDWSSQLDHAQEIALGYRKYNLLTVK
ncbi:MAG: DUF362 domain-containing protein [Deltaproteobacteria bacterium]|nr:DUF362 domain-containing protein [Deltaproteobacteria bacterium]